ncbi:MAG: hypothetical protein P1P93_11030 [Gammaproteobacteria bacterium]|nr:hypothetical protein [Gammaproteobacteria bacterium]MDT8371740.1 hypothetical protein [Gammaproteobacteria bacterium]
MKFLVNLIQVAIVVAIIFPIFHIWDVDKVEQLCRNTKAGMSKTAFIGLAHNSGAKITGPTDDSLQGGKWTAIASSHSPFAKEFCEIKGTSTTVAYADLVEY